MKLTIFFILLGIFQVTASAYSQKEVLTFKNKDLTMREVFKEVEKQSSFRFFYNDILTNIDKTVVLSSEKMKIDDVLNTLLSKTNLSYKILDNNLIIISPKSLLQQQQKVSGTITDAGTGETLPGVSIMIDGTTKGTVTGTDGKYTIILTDANAVLVFSYLGYNPVHVTMNGQSILDIKLVPDITKLNEVVVVGYGTQKRKDLTGAISSIKFENSPLQNLPNVNLLDALKGSMPGFDIGAVTGAGSNPGINIRGQNSIRASNNPLVILDGVVFLGSFNELNPLDIASVDVLKDASSTAIYGSRAANGVVLITSKRGKSDKPTVQMNVTGGIQTYTNRPDMLSPEGYIQLRKDRFLADTPGGTYNINTNLPPYELEAYNANHTIDWFKEITRLAPFKNYELSVSGSSNRSNYYISGNYMDQGGIVVGDQFHKFSILGKVESRITDWLKIGVNLGVTSKNADGIQADFSNGTIDSPYGYKYVHDRGTLYPGFENFPNRLERYPQGQSTTQNPLWFTQQYNEDRNQNYRGSTFARVDVPWVKGLSYTFNYSLNRWEGHSANFQDENIFVNTMNLNELTDPLIHLKEANGSKSNAGRTDWYMNHLINYTQTFGDHSFDATLLAERQGEQNYGMDFSSKDYASTGTTVLGVNALELGNPANYLVNTNLNELYQIAYMARLNYGFKNRYRASISIRKDGYSGFAEGNKYGMFRAGALAWTASEESFVKDNFKFIDNLKFRLSFGENGNPSIGAYQTFPTMGNVNILLGGITSKGMFAGNMANKNLKWEKTTALNFGIDFSIYKNVLSGSLDLYNSNTTDLLLARAIPIINGFGSVLDNIGKVNNKGIEVQLISTNYTTKNLTWKSGLNFWLNRNKIVSLYGLDANKDGIEDDDIANSWFIGKSLGANYTYVMDGIIQKNDAEYIAIYGGQPGDIKFKDLNGDGKIDATNDRTIIGYSKPNYTMTFSNTFTYKNFELYFLINYIAGGGSANYYVGNNVYPYFPNALYGGGAASWLNKAYWTPDNPSNTVTRTNYNNSAYNYGFPKPRTFIRLQDVSFAYRLPDKLLKKTPFSTLRIYASGKNLMTSTGWEGLDPESGTTFANVSGFPVFKIFTFGLNLTF